MLLDLECHRDGDIVIRSVWGRLSCVVNLLCLRWSSPAQFLSLRQESKTLRRATTLHNATTLRNAMTKPTSFVSSPSASDMCSALRPDVEKFRGRASK